MCKMEMIMVMVPAGPVEASVSSVLVRSSLSAVISSLGSNDSPLGGAKAAPCTRALTSHCQVRQLLGSASETLHSVL